MSPWCLLLLLGLGLSALSQIAVGQGQKPVRIFRTAPVVVPCPGCLRGCGQLAPALLSTVSSRCNQATSQFGPNSLFQPPPGQYGPVESNALIQPESQTQGACGCGCASSAGGSPIDSKLLAAPLASFLSSILGGMKEGAVTVQYDGANCSATVPACDCCVPLPVAAPLPCNSSTPETPGDGIAAPSCCPDTPASTECNATENKLAYGVCQSPAEAPKDTADEENLYAIEQDIIENQCPRPPTGPSGCSCLQTSPCPYYGPPENADHLEQGFSNPEFEYVSKLTSMVCPCNGNNNYQIPDTNMMPCQCCC